MRDNHSNRPGDGYRPYSYGAQKNTTAGPAMSQLWYRVADTIFWVEQASSSREGLAGG